MKKRNRTRSRLTAAAWFYNGQGFHGFYGTPGRPAEPRPTPAKPLASEHETFQRPLAAIGPKEVA